MAVTVLISRALEGLAAPEVHVEAHLANGLPSFTLVGLPETEVKEALDRIDIQIEVPALPENELMAKTSAESSESVRERVTQARSRQISRQGKPNAALTPKEIETYCQLDNAGETLVRQAITRLNLSARAYHRILKLALTLADLVDTERIDPGHLAEAIQYRRAFN